MEQKIDSLLHKIKQLTQENNRLKQLLDEHGISYKEVSRAPRAVSKKENSSCSTPLTAMRRLSPQQKITLFRGLFKSREDIFARRWFSTKTGKSGYQPVCQHEWNREFFARLGMRLPIYNIPRIISCAEFTDDYLALPRGCENAVTEFFCSNMVNVAIDDKTNHGEKIEIRFVGILREEQEDAVRQLMTSNIGVLSATTAFGKTVTAIGLIARRKVNTLILVHNRELLNQWKKQPRHFSKLNVPCRKNICINVAEKGHLAL